MSCGVQDTKGLNRLYGDFHLVGCKTIDRSSGSGMKLLYDAYIGPSSVPMESC